MTAMIDNAPGLPSSGQSALNGYMYQLEVSVWTALDLLLAKKVARNLELEPASEEDLEAEIEGEPGALVQKFDFNSYRLVIQCKVRETGPWKHGSLSALLAHGKLRLPAKDRLKETNLRYLLITNADLDGVVRDLRVKDIGDWPSQEIPKTLARQLPVDARGRLAVLATLDSEKIDARTDRLLTERFRVPSQNVNACRERLRQQALERMRGVGNRVWTREQIAEILSSSGGQVSDADAFDGFVPPTNWADFKEALANRHAIIITGPSGTGKTRAAKALIADLRENIRGLNVVYVAGGPEKIQGNQHQTPVVFEIEDPWGRFRLEPDSIPWNDAINELLRTAGPNRKFVITSRSDVLRESGPKSLKGKWFVTLEEDNYGTKERGRLFENRLPNLPMELQRIVLRCRQEAINRLTTPLEVQRYFDVLADGPDDRETSRQYIERSLKEAQEGSIESSILNNVRKREEWRLAAVVWGLFKARSRLSFNVLPGIQSDLTKRDAAFEDELQPYFDFLVAGHHLRQTESVLTYQHPRVELGLESALNEKPGLSSRVLGYLVEVWIQQDVNSGTDWGREGAANLVAAACKQPQLSLDLREQAQVQLDQWIHARVASTGPDFEDDLKLAAAVGSSKNAMAELARWLTHSEMSGMFRYMWSPMEVTSEWVEMVSKDPATETVCSAFIRRLLIHQHLHFPSDFPKHIEHISKNLVPAFRDAALSIVELGVCSNDDPIVAGALADLSGFELVARAAAAYQAKVQESNNDGLWLAISNGEYDDEAADHYAEMRGEEGYTAEVLLRAYAVAMRRHCGWKALRNSPLVTDLLHAWIQDVQNADNVNSDELLALATIAMGKREEAQFWELVVDCWQPVLAPILETRIVDGSADERCRTAATVTLALNMSAKIPDIVQAIFMRSNERRVLELALDFRAVCTAEDTKHSISAAFQVLVGCLPKSLGEATLRIFEDGETPLSHEGLEHFVELVADGNNRLKLAKANVLSGHGIEVGCLVSELLLAKGDDSESEIATIVGAVGLAIRLGLWSLVEGALRHRFADVRERALVALAGQSTGPLLKKLLYFSGDKGYRVRKTLLEIIRERPSAEHTWSLLNLADDSWSPRRRHYDEDADYPLARAAATTLVEQYEIGDEYIERLLDIAKETEDPDVGIELLRAVVRSGSPGGKEKICNLLFTTDASPLHRRTADALVRELDHVDSDFAATISDDHLNLRSAPIATRMALILGARAPQTRVITAAQALSASRLRRTLLVPLYVASAHRDDSVHIALEKLMPAELVTLLSARLDDGPALAHDALDEFGDVRIVDEVRSFCGFLFNDKK